MHANTPCAYMHSEHATNLLRQSDTMFCVCAHALANWEHVVLLTVLQKPAGLVLCILLLWLHHYLAAARSQVGLHVFVTNGCCLLNPLQ